MSAHHFNKFDFSQRVRDTLTTYLNLNPKESYRTLGAKLGVTKAQICRYINQNDCPSIEILVEISFLCNVSIEYLCTGNVTYNETPRVLR